MGLGVGTDRGIKSSRISQEQCQERLLKLQLVSVGRS
jgi:hypothetical protein